MRNWFITGVSSGLGRALAETALARGDRVTGTVRQQSAAQRFAELGGRALTVDVTDHDSIARAVAEAALDGIDVLVNNAGYSLAGTVEETEMAAIRSQFETNFFGPIAVIRAALPSMRARRCGHIVNISSMAGAVTSRGIGFYGGSKMALESLSDALASEVAPFGIKVTIVVPGAFRTELGHARHSTISTIADYAEQNRIRDEYLSAFSTSQRGDPLKAAQSIVHLVEAESPPSRLLLGPDAVMAVRAALIARIEEIDKWMPLSTSTDLTVET
jgi:NAD(P)-dependent dehydrogenase (short-subunit alcohol dehydrogenase family)